MCVFYSFFLSYCSMPCKRGGVFPRGGKFHCHFIAYESVTPRILASFCPNLYIAYFLESYVFYLDCNSSACIAPKMLLLFLNFVWPIIISLDFIPHFIGTFSPFLWSWQHQSISPSFHKQLGFCLFSVVTGGVAGNLASLSSARSFINSSFLVSLDFLCGSFSNFLNWMVYF